MVAIVVLLISGTEGLRMKHQTLVFVLATTLAIGVIGTDDLLAQAWVPQTIDTANPLDTVWFTDSANGWVVGDLGTSFFTDDGGQTWQQVVLTGQDLQGVAFQDASVGLIVGDNGLIFRTVNGGTNWSPVASGTGINLAAVAFGNGGPAYAVGRDGVILRSADAGASWTVAETGSDRYRDVWARGSLFAWAVGDEGVIRVTTDGGLNWFSQTSGTPRDLKGVFFLTDQEGWIAGQNNTLLYTNDGGAIWTPRNSGINVGLDAVQFVDANEGWAVGNLGTIYHSADGGLTWLPENSGTNNELNNLFFVSGAYGWAIGDSGTIVVRLDPTGVDVPGLAGPSIALSPNYPNPFNPSTEIRFRLSESMDISLTIYDASGHRVKTLTRATLTRGEHAVTWYGRDDAGHAVSSGVYVARLHGDNLVRSQKLVLAK